MLRPAWNKLTKPHSTNNTHLQTHFYYDWITFMHTHSCISLYYALTPTCFYWNQALQTLTMSHTAQVSDCMSIRRLTKGNNWWNIYSVRVYLCPCICLSPWMSLSHRVFSVGYFYNGRHRWELRENIICAETLMDFTAVFVFICKKRFHKDKGKHEIQWKRAA